MARIITITSGKGGVGKTSISVNLALKLSESGHRVCLFDADLGLANINILLGLYPEYNLEDVLFNKKSLKDIIIKDFHGIDIIPGSTGVEKIANLASSQVEALIKSFSELEEYDFIIFDTSSGVTKSVISFCVASSEVILVITNEPTSLTDAYSLLKILALNGFDNSVMVIVNQSKNVKITKVIYTRFKGTVQKYLPVKILPLGTVIHDSNVTEAVQAQKPFVTLFPDSIASKCIHNISKQLVQKKPDDVSVDSLEDFFARFLGVVTGPLNLTGKDDNTKPVENNTREGENTETPPEPAASPKQIQFEKSPETENLSSHTHALLEKLEDSISTLSREIRRMREIPASPKEHPPESNDRSLPDHQEVRPVIPLDFEEFAGNNSDS